MNKNKKESEVHFVFAKEKKTGNFIVLDMRTINTGTLKLLLELAFGEGNFLIRDCVKTENLSNISYDLDIDLNFINGSDIINGIFNVCINKELAYKIVDNFSNILITGLKERA